MTKLNIVRQYDFEKIEVNEVEGLKEVMKELMVPIENALDDCTLEESEHKSTDDLMLYVDNYEDTEINDIIPEFEYNSDLECDAELSVSFKFEGLNKKTGEMFFYLHMSEGNVESSYFETSSKKTLFEASFTAKSLSDIKKSSHKHFKELIKIIKNC